MSSLGLNFDLGLVDWGMIRPNDNQPIEAIPPPHDERASASIAALSKADSRLSKKERVGLIFAALQDAPLAENRDQALALMDRVFRKVEDEHSGVPYDPYDKERLYPPVAEMERQEEGKPWLKRYRHTGHYTLIADNGAIVIRVIERGMVNGVKTIVGERTELNKPGADGQRIDEMK